MKILHSHPLTAKQHFSYMLENILAKNTPQNKIIFNAKINDNEKKIKFKSGYFHL